MNDGSALYRARFQWQPTLTSHDPSNILTLNPAPVTYTVTGDVTLTFAVASPQTATYAEPVAVALAFAVAAPQTATYAEPVSIALTFGVDSPFEYVAGTVDYSVTGDVALSFAVDSPFVFTSAAVAIVTVGGGRPVPQRPASPRVSFAAVGSVAFPSFSVNSPVSTATVQPSGVPLRAVTPTATLDVTRVQLQIAGKVIAPVFAFSSVVKVVRAEEEELLLLGVL